MRSTRTASADGGGDAGMRARLGDDRPLPVVVDVVVVDDGMFAMTVARTDWGDTPSVPGAQPVTSRRDAAAIAPTRASEGEIMPSAKARSTPRASVKARGYQPTFYNITTGEEDPDCVHSRRHPAAADEDSPRPSLAIEALTGLRDSLFY